MKIHLTVSESENEFILQLEDFGWLRIPSNVDIIVIPDVPPVTVAPTAKSTTVITPTVTPILPSAVPVIATKGGFDVAFNWLIPQEGGYTNDPDDPGGETMYGIDTKDDKADWTALGVKSVRDLKLDQAKIIYESKYWNGALCNKMDTPLAETHFNYAVNVGPKQAVKFIQESLDLVVDGEYGIITQDTVERLSPGATKALALSIVDKADAFYKGLAAQPRFEKDLNGWLNRNNDLRTFINKIS